MDPRDALPCVCTVLCTEVDAQCNKLAKVIGQTSTVASTVNLVRALTVQFTKAAEENIFVPKTCSICSIQLYGANIPANNGQTTHSATVGGTTVSK